MLLYVHTTGFQQEVLRQIRAIEGVKNAECYDGDYVCVVSLEDESAVAAVTRAIRKIRYVTTVERGR